MKRKYILKSRLRFLTFLSSLIIILSTVFLVSTVNGYKQNTYFEIQVNEGDTLWRIASINRKSGDIRDFIYEIENHNNLKDSTIYPGMVLKIPDKQ